MSQPFSPGRRDILKLAPAAMALAPFLSSDIFAQEKSRFQFCTFTKPLQHLSYEEMSKVLAAMGFDGIEGTVRPGGHVLPENIDEDLPKLMEALKAEGLDMTLMTSAINEVSDEQMTEKVLRTAAEQGVKRFRMGYYKYDLSKPIAPQLDEFRPKLKDLIALTNELGIKPVYQNHSGKNYFGGPIWDLAEVLDDYDPSEVGVAFDIGHATVEGAKAWPLNFARIKPYVDTIYVKEPGWKDNKIAWGGIGKGAVDKAFFSQLLKSDWSGPVSLHVEYLGHKDPDVVPAVLKAMEEDFATLKELLS